MNICKCPNGHFYDLDRFNECPHCAKRSKQHSNNIRLFNLSEKDSQVENVKEAETPSEYIPATEFSDFLSHSENSQEAYSDALLQGGTGSAYYTSDGEIPSEPVVGWLVCVDGIYRGKSFELHCGANQIGRSKSSDISLSLDVSLAEKKVAIVTYESSTKLFIVIPGSTNNILKLNGELLFETKNFKPNDKLTIGSCTLMLIPLCSDNFDWD